MFLNILQFPLQIFLLILIPILLLFYQQMHLKLTFSHIRYFVLLLFFVLFLQKSLVGTFIYVILLLLLCIKNYEKPIVVVLLESFIYSLEV